MLIPTPTVVAHEVNEVTKGKFIAYGAGDFLNDYEGVEGNESYRDDLVLMYFRRSTRGRVNWFAFDSFRCRSSASACGARQRLTPRGSVRSSLAKAGNSGQPLTTGTEASKWN